MDLPINHFKRALQDGKLQVGLWSHLCSPISTEILGHCGFDWMVLDMEHSPNELPHILSQLQALKGSPTMPVVRPPWNDMVTFKRLLDVGAQTLIVPYIQNAEEARRAVAATRYPPQGLRGYAGAPRASGYGRIKDYAKRCADEICRGARSSGGDCRRRGRRRRLHRAGRPVCRHGLPGQPGPSRGGGCDR